MAVFQADTTWVPVVPSFVNFSKNMNRGILPSARLTGLAAGLQFAKAFSSKATTGTQSFEQLQKKVQAEQRATTKVVVAARQAEGTAARQVAIQELKLRELRAGGKAQASQLATAEDRLIRSQHGLAAAEEKTALATHGQNDAFAKGNRSLLEAEKSSTRTSRAYHALGIGVKTAALGAGLAVAGLGVAAVRGLGSTLKPAGDFQKSMNLVAVSTGVGGQGLKDLTALAIDMGAKTSFSAQGASDAMVELAKGGLTAAQIKGGALASTLTLATAGGLGLADASTFMVQGLTSFGLKASQSAQVAAALAGGANASTASVQSLGIALSQVGPGAKTAGLSLQDTVAALAAFDNAGLKGSDAGTSLKTMLTRLVPTTTAAYNGFENLGLVTFNTEAGLKALRDNGVKPLGTDSATVRGQLEQLAASMVGAKVGSAKANKEFIQLGSATGAMSNQFFDAHGNIKSVADVSQTLQTALKGQTKEQKIATLATLFGSDASRAAAVLADNGAAGLAKYVKATNDQAQAQRLAANATKGWSGAQEALNGGIDTLKIQVGTYLLPVLTSVSRKISGNIVPAISGWVTEMGPKLGPALRTAGDLLTNRLLPAVSSLGHIIKNDVVPVVGGLARLLGGTLFANATSVKVVLGALVTVMTARKLGGAAASLVDYGKKLQGLGTNAGAASTKLQGVNREVSGAKFQALSGGAGAASTKLQGLSTNAGTAATKLQGLGSGSRTAAGRVGGLVSGLGGAVSFLGGP